MNGEQTSDTNRSTDPRSHTPGPWHTGGTFMPGSPDARQNVWGPTPPGMQSGPRICEKARCPDARLIAAAPDLLAACKRLRNVINEHVSLEDVDALDAAIAKATGKHP